MVRRTGARTPSRSASSAGTNISGNACNFSAAACAWAMAIDDADARDGPPSSSCPAYSTRPPGPTAARRSAPPAEMSRRSGTDIDLSAHSQWPTKYGSFFPPPTAPARRRSVPGRLCPIPCSGRETTAESSGSHPAIQVIGGWPTRGSRRWPGQDETISPYTNRDEEAQGQQKSQHHRVGGQRPDQEWRVHSRRPAGPHKIMTTTRRLMVRPLESCERADRRPRHDDALASSRGSGWSAASGS